MIHTLVDRTNQLFKLLCVFDEFFITIFMVYGIYWTGETFDAFHVSYHFRIVMFW